MIGAGSVVFCKNLTGDILSYPEFKNATLAYMDIDKERLEVGAALCKKVGQALGANPTIIATQNRREALEGADFVINMVQIGGMDSTLVDFEIPRKYGLNFTIADTTGPGGLFRALRTYPMLKGLCQDMMDVCPNAWILNYSNPMSMNIQAIYRTCGGGVKAVGLCHSVQGTFNQLMGYIGEHPAECEFLCAGINHMAFYLRMLRNRKDLYPRLWDAMNREEVYNSNKVRFELMKMLGYFVTESSEHCAEYNPYFIPRGRTAIEKYSVPIDEYLVRCDGIVEQFERMKAFTKTDDPITVKRSHEYGSTIIHAQVTGKPAVVYGNMPNRGAITNLPPTAIVEVPTLVDRSGCQLTAVGELPPQIVAYVMPHVQQHELFIRAAMEGRRDYIYQAAMSDPLTAATLTLDKIKELCDELIAAHGFEADGGNLPPLDSPKTIVPTSGKTFGRVDPKALHESWDQAQNQAAADHLKNWQIIGPFPSLTPGTVSLKQETAVENDFFKRADGSVDIKASYIIGDKTLTWKPFQANKQGYIGLGAAVGRMEWAVAYAYTEIESVHPRECVLKCGSKDGIKIWLNGEVVHEHEVSRTYSTNEDSVPIWLKTGINRILVKIDNYKNNWGFSISIPKPNF